MTDTEVERLVVRLIGEGSSYQKMMLDAARQSQETASKVELAARRIEGISNQVKGFGQSVLGFMGAIGIATSLKGAFEKFSELERGQRQLKTAIEVGGHSAATTTARYAAFAKEISSTTLTTKGATFAMLKQAELMGKSGADAEKLVRTSVALAGAQGGEAQEWLRTAYAVQTGNRALAVRMVLGRGVKVTEESWAAVQKMVTAGMKNANEEFNSAPGRIERLGRTFNELKVQMGGMVAEGISPVLSKLEEAAGWFKNLDPQVKSTITQIILFTAATTALGGTLPKIISLLSSTRGGYAALAVAIVAGGIAIYNANRDVQAYNESLQESARLNQKLSDLLIKRAGHEIEDIQHISDPGQRESQFAEALAAANEQVLDLEKNLANAKKRRDDLDLHLGPLTVEATGQAAKVATNDIVGMESQLKAAKEAARLFKEEMGKAAAVTSELLIKSVDDLEKELEKATATFGMSEEEIKRWELTQRGATKEQLKVADALADVQRAQKDHQKLMEEGVQVTQESRSAAAKLYDEETHLFVLFTQNAITAETYAAALQKLWEAQTRLASPSVTHELYSQGKALHDVQMAAAERAEREAVTLKARQAAGLTGPGKGPEMVGPQIPASTRGAMEGATIPPVSIPGGYPAGNTGNPNTAQATDELVRIRKATEEQAAKQVFNIAVAGL